MKAVAMVAHPDDCVIFAYSFIYNHAQYDWTICYLTYESQEPRAQEFEQFWKRRNIPTVFLGYQDDYRDIENKKISFDQDQAQREIKNIIANYDLVLTHNSQGDYGHIHHAFVNHATADHPNRVTFAGPGQGTVKYFLPPNVYSLEELPLHRDIVSSFHTSAHVNEYTI